MRKVFGIAAGVLLAGAATVRADIQPDYVGGAPVAVGSDYRFNYDTEVVTDQRVDAGDFFTIYDFKGFVGAGVTGSHTEPANWVFSSSNTGVNPSGTFPIDDPTIPNLTWIYTGPTITGQASLGEFSALSTLNGLGDAYYAGQGTRSTGPDTGTLVFNVGTVTAPVPEPTAIALGIPALLLMRRNRRRA